jgi:putative aldouronate transport system substrate-binding protein
VIFGKCLRILSLLIIFSILFAACSLGGVKTMESNSAETAFKMNNKTKYQEKVIFSYSHIDGDKAGNDQMYDWIVQKFNVEINYLPLTWDNWDEKVRIWIATGDLPDLLWWDFRPNVYADLVKWVKQGVFKPIHEIDEKYPNLKNNLSLLPMDRLKVENKNYIIPHVSKNPEYEGMDGPQFFYRKDWARKLGLDKPQFSYEDFKTFIKECIKRDPGGNGTGKTVGAVGPTWFFPDHMFMKEGSPYFDTYIKSNGKYIWGTALPETLEGIKICKDLYDEGVISKDFYISKDLDGENLFCSGKAPVYCGSVDATFLKKYREKLAENFPGLDSDAVSLMKVLGTHNKTLCVEEYGFWSVSSFSSKVDDEKMERILQMMDYFASKEGMQFNNFGIKGKDWDLVNGQFIQLWERDLNGLYQKPAYMNYTWVYGDFGTHNGNFSLKDNYAVPKSVIDETNNWVEWRKAQQKVWVKLDYDLDFLVKPNKTKYGSFAQETKDEIKKLIVSSDNIDRDWASWLKSMQPRVDMVLQEINEALAK